MIDKRRRSVKDSLGQVVMPGVKVAYNYSGSVASGTVTKVTPGGEIQILRDEEFSGSNRISKVKNGSSVLVLNSPDDPELATAYYETMTSWRETAQREFDRRVDDLHTAAKAREAQIDAKVAEFLNDLKNAWDVDEMKMLAEHHFGIVVE